MNIEDVKNGQLVRLNMDRSRYEEIDWLFMTRQSPQGKKNGPSPEGRIFLAGEFFEATLPYPHRMVTLYEIDDNLNTVFKAYLAEASELTLIKDVV